MINTPNGAPTQTVPLFASSIHATRTHRFPSLVRALTHAAVQPAVLAALGWNAQCGAQVGGRAPAQRADEKLTFRYGGVTRSSTIVIPDGEPSAAGWPTVLVLHGAGGSGEQVLDADEWRTVARRERFIVIAPDGTPKDSRRRARFIGNMRTWNSGVGSGLSATGSSAVTRDVDDVGYLLALLDSVAVRAQVDVQRVFVAGHSNGAGMAYRVAAEHPRRFAAVAVMAGHLYANAPRTLATPVPLLQIVGDLDPLSPMTGGRVRLGMATELVPPALESPTRWAAMNGASSIARIIRDDSVTVRQWGAGNDDRLVLSYVVKGHGHRWLSPGAERLPERLVGPTHLALDATEAIWAFFAARHRRASARS